MNNQAKKYTITFKNYETLLSQNITLVRRLLGHDNSPDSKIQQLQDAIKHMQIVLHNLQDQY